MVAVMSTTSERRRLTVVAERGAGSVWVFQCVEHPGAISESRRLADAERLMGEAIAFVAEVDEDSFDIDVVVQLPEPVRDEIEAAKAAAREAEERQREAAQLSRRAARDLIEVGLTGADTATVLGVSPQRVSQLVNG